MTTPRASHVPTRTAAPTAPGGDASNDSHVRRAGRQLIFNAYGALRAVKLYPVENAAVQKALADLAHQTKELRASEGELERRVREELETGEFERIRG